jgi:hypothetical protein
MPSNENVSNNFHQFDQNQSTTSVEIEKLQSQISHEEQLKYSTLIEFLRPMYLYYAILSRYLVEQSHNELTNTLQDLERRFDEMDNQGSIC